MIRRLRIKFVCINMVLVTAMLWAILAVVLHSTQAGLASESMRAMEAAALPGPQRPAGPGWGPRCFTLEPGPGGDLIASPGADSFGGEAWLRQVWEAARGRQEGLLEEEGLRFRRVGPPERQKVVFADASGELAAIASLRRSCLLVGCGGFLAFLGLSILLARWAVGPVDQAWRRQQQFVADASHELKTPLTVILANAELLADPGCTGGEGRQPEGYGALRGGVLPGVVQEDVRRLGQLHPAAPDPDPLLHPALQGQPRLEEHRLKGQQGVPHQPAQIHRLLGLPLPRVHPGQLQQPPGERRIPPAGADGAVVPSAGGHRRGAPDPAGAAGRVQAVLPGGPGPIPGGGLRPGPVHRPEHRRRPQGADLGGERPGGQRLFDPAANVPGAGGVPSPRRRIAGRPTARRAQAYHCPMAR